MSTFCKNCAHYEIEWQYCFKVGCHTPETGCCGGWKEKVESEELMQSIRDNIKKWDDAVRIWREEGLSKLREEVL